MSRSPTSFPRGAAGPVLLLALLGACSGSSDDTGSSEVDPAEAFRTVEERLLGATTSRVDFTITATGSVEVQLEGSLLLAEEGRARLEGRGTFAGDEVALLLVSDGARMRLSNGGESTEAAAPPGLEEALVIGLTRMGILHNLARLTEPAAPDHADGGAREWVEAVEFRREERGSVAFDIRVAGQPTGAARLFLAPGTGLPGERRQTVDFPEGEMQVTELYGAVSLGATMEPGTFELD